MRLLRTVIAAVAALALAPAAVGLAASPVIALDPGHGGADSGAVGVLPVGTVTGLTPRTDPSTGVPLIFEKDVNLDVAQRVNAFLVARGYTTVLTRTRDLAGGDQPYTTELADLQARVDVAVAAGAAIFVSLHENALTATAAGTETYHYYYASENSRVLAQLIHTNLIAALGLPDRGVQEAGFYVLRKTPMPAVLIEGMFLSNPSEALLLADPAVRQKIAEAVGAGIVSYFGAGYGTPPPTINAVPKYQVNVGAYRELAKAKHRRSLVRARGYRAAVVSQYSRRYGRTMFVVVAGKYALLHNARSLRDRMRADRLPAVLGPVPRTARVVVAR